MSDKNNGDKFCGIPAEIKFVGEDDNSREQLNDDRKTR